MLILLAAAVPAACGDAGGPSDIDDDPPASPDLARIAVVPPSPDAVARVVGEEDAVDGSHDVRVVNPDATTRNGGTVVEATTTAAANGSFFVEVPAQLGDDLILTAIDADGDESQPVTASSGPEPDAYTGEDLADVEMFLFANQAGAITLPFETGDERFIVVAQSLNPNGNPFEIKVTGALGTRITDRGLGLAARGTHPAPPEAGIREAERRSYRLLGASAARPRALAAAQDIGDSRDFFVVNRTEDIDIFNPDHFDEVTATLRFIDDHTEIWVDDRTPAGNLPDAVIEVIGTRFDDESYPTDRAAFGEESDVDENGRVLILLTPNVNALNTQESVDAGVALLGFFFGNDLNFVADVPLSNEAEIFYAIIPDPTMEFSPLRVLLAGIEEDLGGIFAHEFEHMISANQHILVRSGEPEDIWLDEGLAHHAETLNGFPFQNRLRSALYLDEPEVTPLVGGDDSLERRGAGWLFVQYLADRFGEDILGALVQTRLTGIPNVEQATNRSMPFLFHEWTSALFLDGISDDPLFLFASLDIRTEFEQARQQLEEELGEFLGIVERTLGPPASTSTLRREVNGLAAGYFEVGATGPGARTIVFDSDGPVNLQTAVFRIE